MYSTARPLANRPTRLGPASPERRWSPEQIMKETEFRNLCRNISRALHQPDVESLGEHGRIDIDGVDIALFFDEQVNPDMLFCYVDMGPIADTARTEVYGQLLSMNLLSGAKTNGVYSLDPASGNALFVVHFMNPESLKAEQLAEAFKVYATQTNSLRSLLEEEAEAEADTGMVRPASMAAGRGASMVDLA
jgi:hypothetical protein